MLRIMLRTKSSHMMPVLALCVYCHFCTQRVPAGTEHGYLLPFLYAVSTNRDTGHSAHCPCLTHTSAHILSCSRVDLVQLIIGRGLTLYWTRWHFIPWTWSKYYGLQVSQGHTLWTRSTAYKRPLKKDPFFEASKNRIFTITLLSFHMHLKNGFSGG